MPLYELLCENGHTDEAFYHSPLDYGARTVECRHCRATMERVPSFGAGTCYFEEGRGRWIENLAKDAVFVTSAKQHQDLMKKAGVTWATRGRGAPGCWV